MDNIKLGGLQPRQCHIGKLPVAGSLRTVPLTAESWHISLFLFSWSRAFSGCIALLGYAKLQLQ